MFNKLYITIKSNNKLDDCIIDPISFILIDWGVDSNLIDWDIYSDRAKLEISLEANNYKSYNLTYQGLNSIMELCYEEELIMTTIDNDGTNEIYTMYISKHNSTNYITDVFELID